MDIKLDIDPTTPLAMDNLVNRAHLNIRESALIRRIQEAFAGVKLGGGRSLNMTEYYDSYQGASEYLEKAKHDERQDWRKIADATLEQFTVTFSFTDVEGFRFYLPAYMIWTIRNHRTNNSIIGNYTIYALDVDHPVFAKVGFVNAFTPEQLNCIVDFLTYCVGHRGTCDALVARRHLDKIRKLLP
ncbi:MAG: hypothetical protein EA366_14670 [Spirulina sp. DLM2.Bin59]|nr:MAG: hypothetical protein EA366_14670 [Spirulina sp. DLM2.Bin59]